VISNDTRGPRDQATETMSDPLGNYDLIYTAASPTTSCCDGGSPSSSAVSSHQCVGGDFAAPGIVSRLRNAMFSTSDDGATSTPSYLAVVLGEVTKYEVCPPDVNVVLGMTAGIVAQLLIGVAFAAIVYTTLSLRRSSGSGISSISSRGNNIVKDEDSSGNDNGKKWTRLLIGTVLIPSSILMPYALIALFNIENSAARFALCSPFVLYLFRTLEAVFGFVPAGAAGSFRVYAAYFALPFDMSFDATTNEPILATGDEIRAGARRAALDVAAVILLCSALSPRGYMPFGSRVAEGPGSRAPPGLLRWRHLGDCLAIALFFQTGLSVASSVIGGAIEPALGYRSAPAMRSPITGATSPSDFWGRRWNVLVHAAIKRGVYKPVRQRTGSALAASMAAFAASGAFHEWLVHACFLHGRPDNWNRVRIGSQAAFFAWNFAVVAIEGMLIRHEGFARFAKMVPRWLVPPFIVMTSLPVAHWFWDPYMNGGFFPDYESCLPMIRKAAKLT
jgi:hypothetical protein